MQDEQKVYRERDVDHSESKLRLEVCESLLEVDEPVFARLGVEGELNGRAADDGGVTAGEEAEEEERWAVMRWAGLRMMYD